jgi:RNA polymerase sigma-70 factor (ECF subfamily)
MERAVSLETRPKGQATSLLKRPRAELGQLIQRHDRGLRALVYRLLADRDAMDDVLQEVYLKAHLALPHFRGEAEAGTWLYRIAYNTCVDALRRRRELLPIGEEAMDEPAAREPDPGERVAQKDLLARALGSLSPEHRAAGLLVDSEGYDHEAAGYILGVPPGTVASRLHYARAELRRSRRAQREEER